MARQVGSMTRAPTQVASSDIREKAERLFVVLSLMVFAGAIGPFLDRRDASDGLLTSAIGQPELRLLNYPIYIITAVLLLLRFSGVVRLVRTNWTLMLLVALALSSTLWSADPELTFRRSVALAATTAFGFYVVMRFSIVDFVKLLIVTYVLLGTLSLLLVLYAPSVGTVPEMHGVAWRGVFTHKNVFGQAMMWGSVAAIIMATLGTRLSYVLMFGYTFSLLLLSHSLTSILVVVLLLPAIGMVAVFRRTTGLSALTIACLTFGAAAFLALLLIFYLEPILDWLGRDRTLTGRTALWRSVWDSILDRFWYGYGYGAFWDGSAAPSYRVRALVDWSTPNAHNGWLETWLSLGLTGVALLMQSVVSTTVRSIHCLRRGRHESATALLMLFALFLANLVESQLLIQNSISWVIYVVLAAGGAHTVLASQSKSKQPSMGPSATVSS